MEKGNRKIAKEEILFVGIDLHKNRWHVRSEPLQISWVAVGMLADSIWQSLLSYFFLLIISSLLSSYQSCPPYNSSEHCLHIP